MPDILPKERLAPTKVDPAISIFYGPPKIGKTGKVAELDDCLLLDAEKGAQMISALRIPISSISGGTTYMDNPDGTKTLTGTSIDAVYGEFVGLATEYAKANPGKKMPPPYKFVAFDTVDKLEEMCEVTATAKYKASPIGKTFEGASVLELPNGGGYYHLRNEVVFQVDRLATVCKHLILISHIKEKTINKGGVDVSVADISLAGKLGSIICAKADLIGYVYRQKLPGADTSQLMVSFETTETNVMGTRIERLAGKRIPFDWKEIFTQQ